MTEKAQSETRPDVDALRAEIAAAEAKLEKLRAQARHAEALAEEQEAQTLLATLKEKLERILKLEQAERRKARREYNKVLAERDALLAEQDELLSKVRAAYARLWETRDELLALLAASSEVGQRGRRINTRLRRLAEAADRDAGEDAFRFKQPLPYYIQRWLKQRLPDLEVT